jgi:4-aminobutyrate aminotransferase/(S)-3-amino-2-methylpropionate transaminase
MLSKMPDPCGPGKLFAPVHSINLRTEIPGPKSRQILARRAAAVGKGLSTPAPVVAARAHGALVWDVDGNTFIDFAGRNGALVLGHTPEPIIEALTAQAESLIHLGEMVAPTEQYIRVCELLNELTPDMAGPKKSILFSTEAEAIENAIRAARAFTGRETIISFEGGEPGFGAFAPEVHRFPFPDVFRRSPRLTDDTIIDRAIAAFEQGLASRADPRDVAAVIIEPAQGEGGCKLVPPRFMQHIARRCQKTGMLLVVDETQMGLARTGKMFAVEHFGVRPDILVTASSIAAGLPLSAITGRAEVVDSLQPAASGVNPLACAAAICALTQMRDEDLPRRAAQIGELARERMLDWQRRWPKIGDVRGLGALLALELVSEPGATTPGVDEAARVVSEAAQNGLLILKAGPYGNCIPLLFPLVIPEEQLNEGLDVLELALERALA